MADTPPPDKPGWWFIELYALGAILHGFDVMIGGVQAAILWWALGSVLAVVGWHWNRIKPLLGQNFEETERKVVTDFRWWAGIAVAIFVLPMISRYIDSALLLYSRITDPPSESLGLTDAQRWRLTLRLVENGNDPRRCNYILTTPSNQPPDQLEETRALEQELVQFWRYALTPPQNGTTTNSNIPYGITLFTHGVPAGSTYAINCARQIAPALQDMLNLPIYYNDKQDSEALTKCIANLPASEAAELAKAPGIDPCVEIRINGAK
jgi:hypothetical protein